MGADAALGFPDFDLCRMVTGFPKSKVVVFDLETTGLHPTGGDEILSISICDADGGRIFSTLVKPKFNSSWPEAQKVNGITPEMASGGKTIEEVRRRTSGLFDDEHLIVGYNIGFDLGFLLEYGVAEECPANTFDVMTEYAKVHGSRRARYGGGFLNSKLTECAESYGYRFDAHDSMEDAVATAYCFNALLADEAYFKPIAESRSSLLRIVRTTHTKETERNASGATGYGPVADSPAELRLGAVTKGKNKGAPRYECYLDGAIVGIAAHDTIDNVAELMQISPGTPMPEKVTCRVSIRDDASSRPRVEARITESSALEKSALQTAKDIRESMSCYWRKAAPAQKAATVPKPVSANKAAPAQKRATTNAASTRLREEPQAEKSREKSTGSEKLATVKIAIGVVVAVAVIAFIAFVVIPLLNTAVAVFIGFMAIAILFAVVKR